VANALDNASTPLSQMLETTAAELEYAYYTTERTD
jgi:hypothetical protein